MRSWSQEALMLSHSSCLDNRPRKLTTQKDMHVGFHWHKGHLLASRAERSPRIWITELASPVFNRCQAACGHLAVSYFMTHALISLMWDDLPQRLTRQSCTGREIVTYMHFRRGNTISPENIGRYSAPYTDRLCSDILRFYLFIEWGFASQSNND